MNFHPASNLFPLLDGEDFEKFKKDIQKNGCLEPVIILDDMILDGRNRWRVCEELGIQPTIKEICTDTPVEFVLSMNLHRRHLTESQKAQIGAEALPEFEIEAKKRQVESPSGKGKRLDVAKLPEPIKGRASEKVADLVGVSPRYIQEAKKIKEERPDLAEKIKAGEMSIPEAKREMKPLPKLGPPCQAMQYARLAILDLEKIHPKDIEREEAFSRVKEFIKNNEIAGKNTKKEPEQIAVTEAMGIATFVISHLGRIRKDDPKRGAAIRKVIDWCKKNIYR